MQSDHSILCSFYQDFMVSTEKEIPHVLNPNSPGVSTFLRGYDYPVSIWPTVLEEDVRQLLEKLSVTIPKLLKQITSVYFKDNVEDIAHYYFQGDIETTNYALMCHAKNCNIGCRLDLIRTPSNFKLLEVNIGSSIGGMEIQNFEPIIRRTHRILRDPTNNIQLVSRNIQENYISFLVDQILDKVAHANKEINVFLSFNASKDEMLKNGMVAYFDKLLKNELSKRNIRGGAFTGALDALSFSDGSMSFNKIQVHAILNMEFSLNIMNSTLFRALITDSIYFPDHLGLVLQRDKRNLALLRKIALTNGFTASENELILSCIPWTQVIEYTQVEYNDESIPLVDLILRGKDFFVIKPARGFRGENVHIGKYISTNDWLTIIEEILANKEPYIVQEFCNSWEPKAPTENNKWERHKLIWGSYGFGNKYGGSIVRMIPSSNKSDVINAAQGAILGLVYETT